MKKYRPFIGRLIDQGKPPLTIARAILKADQNGTVNVPFKAWAIADRLVMLVKDQKGKSKSVIARCLNETPSEQFLLASSRNRGLRKILKDPNYSLANCRERPLWQSRLLKAFPDMEALWGEDKHQLLKHWKLVPWSEERYQEAYEWLNRISRSRKHHNADHLHLWLDGVSKMDGTYLKRSLPFDALLCDRNLGPLQKQAARRVAEHILAVMSDVHEPIEQNLSLRHVRTLERTLDWLVTKPPRCAPRYLKPLLPLATRFQDMNWDQFDRLLVFIKYQRSNAPDPALLKDFVDGYVDIRGVGLVRAEINHERV